MVGKTNIIISKSFKKSKIEPPKIHNNFRYLSMVVLTTLCRIKNSVY